MNDSPITIPVPFVPDLATLPELRKPAAARAVLESIKLRYGATITWASKISNVPEEILYAVIFKESRGQASLVNKSTATGLMQIKPRTANGFIVQENVAGQLTSAEKQVLRRFLGARLDCILSQKWGGDTKPKCMGGQAMLVTVADLQDPEFNIHVGAIGWSYALRLHREPDGIARFDRAWVHTALGEGTAKKMRGKTIPQSLAFLNGIGWGDYFINLAGRGSILDLIAGAGIVENTSVVTG